MSCLELHHNTGQYALALQFGNYRAAARICIVALRRYGKNKDGEWGLVSQEWIFRLNHCLALRHRGHFVLKENDGRI